MENKKVLFLYINPGSGHHCAAKALEQAVNQLYPQIETHSIDSLKFAYPVISKVILKTYTNIIQRTPQIWDYLYDNREIHHATREIREVLNHLNSKKFGNLLETLHPSVIVCTQAAPCTVAASYKKNRGWNIPLIGVVTDFHAHAYWVADCVDIYIVAAQETKDDLIHLGIPPDKIKILGIPINPKFIPILSGQKSKIEAKHRLKLNPWLPLILVMGGSQGLGPMEAIIKQLNHVRLPWQGIMVCGSNKKLRRKLRKKASPYSNFLRIMGFTKNIDKIMDACDLIITKPGGMTSSEALAKGLPMIIVNPIPGQEELNSQFLTSKEVAIGVDDFKSLHTKIEYLLKNPLKLEIMRNNALKISKPEAAQETAKLINGFLR